MRSTGLHSPARHRPGLAPGFVHLAVSVLGMGSPARRRQGLCLAAGWMPSAVRRVAARRGLLSRCVSVHEAMTRTRATRGRPSFQKTGVDCGIGRSGRISPRKKTETPHTNQPLRTLLLLCYLSWNPCGQPVEKVWNVSASGSAAACRSGEGGSNLCRSKTGNRPLGGFLWGRKTTPPGGSFRMAGAPTPRTIGRRFRRSFTAFQRAGGPLSLVLVFGLRWNLRVKKRPAARQPGEVRRRLRCPIPSSQPHPATSASRGEHLASAGPLPLLGVLGAGQPRPLRPAGHVRELGEHLTSAGRLPGLVPWPSSWCSPAAVDLADAGPLPLLDVPGTGRPRPLRPAGYARELGEHLADAGPLPRLDVLGAGQPRPLRLLATSASWASTRPTPARCRGWTCSAPGNPDPCGLLPTSASRASTWPTPARCRCWTRPAPGSPDPCGLQHPAGHVGEPGEHLAGPDPLPLLDVLGAGQPRPLRPVSADASPTCRVT